MLWRGVLVCDALVQGIWFILTKLNKDEILVIFYMGNDLNIHLYLAIYRDKIQ